MNMYRFQLYEKTQAHLDTNDAGDGLASIGIWAGGAASTSCGSWAIVWSRNENRGSGHKHRHCDRARSSRRVGIDSSHTAGSRCCRAGRFRGKDRIELGTIAQNKMISHPSHSQR